MAKTQAEITLAVLSSITSSTRFYLIQASTLAAPAKPTTSTPSSSWTTTEPTYTEGSTNTLYTCERTIFADASFIWSDVSTSSSYEAAKSAYNKAVAAKSTADATAQYFSHDDSGAHIMTTASSPDTGFNSLWTATKLAFRNATTELMTVGADLIELGKNSASAIISLCNGTGSIQSTAAHEGLVGTWNGITIDDGAFIHKKLSGINHSSVVSINSEGRNENDNSVSAVSGVVSETSGLGGISVSGIESKFYDTDSSTYKNISGVFTQSNKSRSKISLIGESISIGSATDPLTMESDLWNSTEYPMDNLAYVLSRTVLYTNDNGSTDAGTLDGFTLSESIANYSHIQVFYNYGGIRNSAMVKTRGSYGITVPMYIIYPDDNTPTLCWVKVRTIGIVGAAVANGTYGGYVFGSYNGRITAANEIRVMEVVGWK